MFLIEAQAFEWFRVLAARGQKQRKAFRKIIQWQSDG